MVEIMSRNGFASATLSLNNAVTFASRMISCEIKDFTCRLSIPHGFVSSQLKPSLLEALKHETSYAARAAGLLRGFCFAPYI
jgi:hypothetical protein